jgi:hypothetical protein
LAGGGAVVNVVTAVALGAEVLVVRVVAVLLVLRDLPELRVTADVAVVLVKVEAEVDVDVETSAPFDVVGGSGAAGRWVGLQPESESHRGTATAATAAGAHDARARDLPLAPKRAHLTTRSSKALSRARPVLGLPATAGRSGGTWPERTGPERTGPERTDRVASTEPPSTAAKPTAVIGPNFSPRTATPNTTATAGFRYVMTVARIGPTSAISAKKAMKATAVHTATSPAIDASTEADSAPVGRWRTATGA